MNYFYYQFVYNKNSIVMDFQQILKQLDNKIQDVEQLKNKIQKELSNSNLIKQLKSVVLNSIRPAILNQLNTYKQYQITQIQSLHDHFTNEIVKNKVKYENQIKQLQGELSKQYKLIGCMKQQLEDLSELVNQQMSSKQQSSNVSLENTLSNYQLPLQLPNNDIFQCSTNSNNNSNHLYLQVIEEETERTIMSSCRSENKNNFIKIQQPSYEQYAPFDSKEGSPDQYQSHQSKQSIIQSKKQPLEDSLDTKTFQNKLTVQQIILDCDMCRSEAFQQITQDYQQQTRNQKQTQNKQINQIKSQYNTKYSSIPMQMNKHLNESPLSFQAQCINLPIFEAQSNKNEEYVHVTPVEPSSYRQPKTKQFLQQFRKTFNKCLSSMHVSKKYSNKINQKYSKGNNITNSNNLSKNVSFENRCEKGQVKPPMQVTFGKLKPSSQNNKSLIERQSLNGKQPHYINKEGTTQNKQNYSKIVSAMLKQKDNGNRFLVGDQKSEIKYEGQKKDYLREGNGIIYYSNGICYEGQFKRGLRQGYGILRFNHIQIFNGDWKDDEINGQGKIRNCAIINRKKSAQNGSILNKWISYCGQFRNSRFEGEGTLYLQGGEKFLGKFIAGMACGQGTLYKKNGEIESGIWKNNVMVKIF